MRRLLAIFIVVMAIQCVMVRTAVADGITVDIPVVVDGGGTVVMTPKDDAPAPNSLEIHVDDGETGHFSLPITAPGNYVYDLALKGADAPNANYDKTVYTVKVAVFVSDHDDLSATVVLYRDGSSRKYGTMGHRNALKWSAGDTNPPDEDEGEGEGGDAAGGDAAGASAGASTGVGARTSPSTSASTRSGSHPKTGDGNELERYLLMSVFASAGLFALSVIYTVFTRRTLKQ